MEQNAPTTLTPRPKLERELESTLGLRGKSICVSGPRKSGKTSLVMGVLANNEIDHIYCAITQDTTWEDLCLEVFKKGTANSAPIKQVSEHDVARALGTKNAILVIDNFEHAGLDLTDSISDLCKIMVTNNYGDRARLIMIGSDDLLAKLCEANHSLDCRLGNITVPALRKQKLKKLLKADTQPELPRQA